MAKAPSCRSLAMFVFLVLLGALLPLTLSSTPAGHLKPLGSHRPADIKVPELDKPISSEEFFDEYVRSGKPVVLRGFAKQWPAFTAWTDEYLVEQYGDMEVKIELGGEGAEAGSLGLGRDTIRSFLTEDTERSVFSELPLPMYKEVLVYPALNCGELSRSLAEVDLRISGSWRSPLVRDGYNQLSCQVQGGEKWILFNPSETANLYVQPSNRYELSSMSPIDVDSVDLTSHPLLSNVHFALVNLSAGDCLFVPGGHYHHIRSSGARNLAVVIQFSMVDKLSSEECKDVTMDAKPLDQFDVLWQWKGSGTMDMGRGDDYFFKMIFKNGMVGPKPKLNKRALARLLRENFDWEMDDEEIKVVDEIMSILDVNQDGAVTPVELDLLDRHLYRNISVLLEGPPDLANTYDFEFGVVDYNQLRESLEELLGNIADGEGVDADTFLDTYMSEPLGGSEVFGRKLFAKFDTNSDGLIKADEGKLDGFDSLLAEYEIGYEGEGGRLQEGEGAEGSEGEEGTEGEEGESEEPGAGEEEDDDWEEDEDGEEQQEGSSDSEQPDSDNDIDLDDDDDNDELEIDGVVRAGKAEKDTGEHDEL